MGVLMIAYLDAGTGSMLVGAVAAGAAGVGVAVRGAFGRLRRGRNAPAEPEDSAEQTESNETAGDAPS
jgi:hypothetical protein